MYSRDKLKCQPRFCRKYIKLLVNFNDRAKELDLDLCFENLETFVQFEACKKL